MKKISKVLSVVLAILMVISIVPITASAETSTSGTCGENATWEFDETTGTLTIFGEGAMYDYYYHFYSSKDEVDTRPWASYEDLIEFVVVDDGITYIGEYAFLSFNLLTIVTIPESVTRIGEHAFESAEPLVVHYKGTESQWNNVTIVGANTGLYYERLRFYFVDFPVSDSGTGGEDITWSFDVETLTLTIAGTGTMYNDLGDYRDNSTRKQFDGEREWDYYKYHIEKIVIKDGVTYIGQNVFNYHPNIKEVVIPDTVTEIHLDAFNNCNSLSDIYYSSTENDWNNIKIWKSLFDNSNSSLDNATIHYNSTGPQTHDYEAVITEPTCTEQGYTTYTCECGDSYVDDYVNAIGHSFGNWTTEIAPTCTETGLEKRVCSACGETETNELSSIGHDYDYNNGVLTRPTETAKGFYTYTCKNDISHITTEEVESADYTEYNKVARKLEEYLSNSNITSEAKSYIMAECVNIMRNNAELYNFSSLTERRDLIASEQYIVDKATKEFNEFFQVVDSVIANCESGNHDVRVYISNDNATCTVNGTKRGACYYCGSEVIVDDENNPALGHDIVVDNAIAPTCTGTGLTEGSHCSRCDDATTEQEFVPKLGHSYNAVIIPPTCTEQGYTTYTCECGDSYVDDYVDALGHNYSSEITTPATHTTTGILTYTCACGDVYTEIIDKLSEHNHEAVLTPPTCTEQGYTTYTCECGDSYVDDYVDATGHNYIDNVCTGCGDTIILNGWQLENGKWAYYVNNEKLANKWIKDSVDWCYLGADGYCVTNTWAKDSNGWCYVGADCRIVYNKWIYDNSKWYFIDANGYMVSNKWMKDSKDWVYLGSNGAMLTNAWAKDSQGWCYVGSNGYCVKNQWIEYNNNWYYIDANGYMVTGTVKIGPVTYKFNSNGVWIA